MNNQLEDIINLTKKYDLNVEQLANEYVRYRKNGLNHFPAIQLMEMKYCGDYKCLFCDNYNKEEYNNGKK